MKDMQSKQYPHALNEWVECTEEHYWVEDDPELKDRYFTVVSMPLETYDDKTDTTLHEQFIYLRSNCPYSWDTLVKSGARFMVVEKPGME